jgi:hypothetical protein
MAPKTQKHNIDIKKFVMRNVTQNGIKDGEVIDASLQILAA